MWSSDNAKKSPDCGRRNGIVLEPEKEAETSQENTVYVKVDQRFVSYLSNHEISIILSSSLNMARKYLLCPI